MIASSGFFSNIPCPFLRSGLCERPHCHFSHQEKSSGSTSTDVSSSRWTRFHTERKATSLSYESCSTNEKPVYIPTPLQKLKAFKSPEADESSSKSRKSSSVPEYKPTPISELNKLRRKSRDSPKSSGFSSKTKKLKTDVVVKKEDEDDDNVVEILVDTKLEKKSSKDVDEKPKVKEDKKNDIPKITLQDSGDDEPVSPELDSEPLFDDDPVDTVLSSLTTGKKRVAHAATSSTSVPASAAANLQKVFGRNTNAKQQMLNRFKALTSTSPEKTKKEEPSTSASNDAVGKKRVAHTVNLPSSTSSASSTSKSNASSFYKNKVVPSQSGAVKRPTMPLDFVVSGGKIPLIVRQQYLSKFLDECSNLTDDMTAAYERGLKEEKSLYDRSKNKQMYSMYGANQIVQLRNELKNKSAEQSKSPTKTKDGNNIVSHQSNLNGPQAKNFSVFKKEKVNMEDVPEDMLYDALQSFIMTKEKLKDHGYPLPDNTGKAVLPTDSRVLNNFKTKNRICFRCLKSFAVKDNGFPLKKEACTYHSGKLWTSRVHGQIIKQYSCCKNEPNSLGCCCSDVHVVDGSGHPDYLTGYVSTETGSLVKTDKNRVRKKVYALDCEMCNTTIGMELTRITVVDTKCKTVLESLVKPGNPILDYNTKFSGIKEGDLNGVTKDLQYVQRKLLKLFDSNTIVIGHSLESDFKALKLFHPTVIDTTDVFPHRKGLPFKRALRTIVAEVMMKIIQDDVGGHDSAEDAISCMKLMLSKASHVITKMKSKDQSNLVCKITVGHTTSPSKKLSV